MILESNVGLAFRAGALDSKLYLSHIQVWQWGYWTMWVVSLES